MALVCMYGIVFDLRRFNFKSKTFHVLIRKFLYVDGIDFHTEDDMLHIVVVFTVSCSKCHVIAHEDEEVRMILSPR